MSSEIINCKTIESLQNLRLSEVDLQWVDDVVGGNFCEIDGLPAVLREDSQGEKFFLETLSKICNVSRRWCEIDDTNCKFNDILTLQNLFFI